MSTSETVRVCVLGCVGDMYGRSSCVLECYKVARLFG